MTTPFVEYLLIGGGLASATAAETLRIGGARGRIAILSAEPVLPYHRPPLSKGFLIDGPSRTGNSIHDQAFYRERGIETLLGVRALGLDVDNRTVATDNAGRLRFQKLLIATGAGVNRLAVPGADLQGIYHLHTVEDGAALHRALAHAGHAVVVGASFVGMELAATFAARGIATTLIAKDALLYDKLSSPEISAFFAEHYEARGIELLFGERVEAFSGTTRVEGVVTGSGRTVPCDIVAIGVGVHPEIGFLDGSGLRLEDGVVVDQYLETEHPGIFAAGDVANFLDPVARTRHRVEHWDNAVKQGRIAAWNMLGARQSWRTVSYFFSDVLDLTFNVVGATADSSERILRGSVESRSFSVLYLDDNRLRGAFLLERSLVEAKAAGALIINRSDLAATRSALADSRLALDRAAVQTVLVLQGGGALGAFECGVVKALEERRIHPDLVAGVSIGAFNAVIIAGNPRNAAAALEAFWRELSLDTPDVPDETLRRAVSSLQSLIVGAPNFFRPRWLQPVLSLAELATLWTSFYDPSPILATLTRHVDFDKLKDSPTRLLLSAVDVESGELATFDSYVDEITPRHVLASGSLPPGFPWTTIDGRHYWDGGLVSNSPLDQVVELGGLTGKRIYIVNLWPSARALPRSMPEVMARRDEIILAEKISRNVRTWEHMDNYRRLVEEILGNTDPRIAEQIRRRPHFIETFGEAGPLSITRIAREAEPHELGSRDYELSRRSIEELIVQGYEVATKVLEGEADASHPTP